MTRAVSYQTRIALPRAACWEKLRDLSVAHHYVPGLVRVEVTTPDAEGVGASRRVYRKAGDWVDETVEEWQEGRGFLIHLHRGENGRPPLFRKAWFRYALDDGPDGDTVFTATLSYVMPWGRLGGWLERVLRKAFRSTVRDVALAMKDYYETGLPVSPARLREIKAAARY